MPNYDTVGELLGVESGSLLGSLGKLDGLEAIATEMLEKEP
jgi:hypothetical protein